MKHDKKVFSVTEIPVDEHKKIYIIQKEFCDIFPYLKLEFFVKLNASYPMKHINKSISECCTVHSNGRTFTITPHMTVSDLVRNFMDFYGLSVKVFRQSGSVWLESTITDGWTLEEQNKEGEILSQKS